MMSRVHLSRKMRMSMRRPWYAWLTSEGWIWLIVVVWIAALIAFILVNQ